MLSSQKNSLLQLDRNAIYISKSEGELTAPDEFI